MGEEKEDAICFECDSQAKEVGRYEAAYLSWGVYKCFGCGELFERFLNRS